MEKFVRKMLRLRGPVVGLFFAAAALCLILSRKVAINFNMVDYLPEQAPSTIALDIMDDAYDKAVPNLRVMLPVSSLPEAMEYKERLAAVEGVEDINWLDDQVDIRVPLAMHDEKTVADWYADGYALYAIVLDEDSQREALEEIGEIIGADGALSGNPVDTVTAQSSTGEEVARMMMIILPMVFVILLFTTTSWMEPVLFMINVGVAIALNLGTNLLLGEISFVTKTTATILQLACSMDYAIFLLDRFAEYRTQLADPMDAMARAVSKSMSSILSSGLTTVVGFAALIIMQFKIGADMGIVLAKGIVCSLFTTLVFMPCLAMYSYKWVDKTTHRSFMPPFRRLGIWANRSKSVVTVLVAVLLVPCYLAQHQIRFEYGMSGMSAPGSKVAEDREAVNAVFGESTSFALLVPMGSIADEQALGRELKELPEVSSLLSYTETVGSVIPAGFLPEDTVSQLNSGGYTRMVLTARIPPESDESFAFVAKVRTMAQEYYPDSYHLAGEVANVYDMKDTITSDNVKVNLISVGAIALILLFNFRSLSLPFMLLLTIESSIFINVAVPYFADQSINYIGFLIISSVQLGATVDYAILFTNRYLENRAELPKKKAAQETIANTAGSILTSGGILALAGLVLGVCSSNMLISQLGILLARGAVLSAILVMVFLPAQLTWLEGLVRRTTLGLKLKPKEKKKKPPKEEKLCNAVPKANTL